MIFSSTDARRLKDAAYDAIFAFPCINDMAQPVATLTPDAPGDPPGWVGDDHGRSGR